MMRNKHALNFDLEFIFFSLYWFLENSGIKLTTSTVESKPRFSVHLTHSFKNTIQYKKKQ